MYLTQKTRSCLRKERNYKRTGPLALRCRTMYAPFRPKIDHHMKMSDLFARLWKDGNKAAPDFQLGFVVFNRFLFFLSFFECMLHAFRILVFRKTAGNFLLSEIPYFKPYFSVLSGFISSLSLWMWIKIENYCIFRLTGEQMLDMYHYYIWLACVAGWPLCL